MSFYFAQSVPFSFRRLSDGNLAFMLKNSGDLIINEDGSVTWTVREIGLGLHSFIELTTGEQTKRKIYIPLCLINLDSRKYLQFLLETTRARDDARYNSQPARFYILTADGKGFHAKVRLQNLATHYVMLQLMPPEFALRYRSVHCPFCTQILESG